MNIKDNKVNEESGQGRRLIQFRIEKGFNSRLSFANELKVSVTTINDIENNLRKISKNLIARIAEKWQDTNENWLIYGTPPKLLTGNPEEKTAEIVAEEMSKYVPGRCELCKEKDMIIEEYKKIIAQQRQLIDKLTDSQTFKK